MNQLHIDNAGSLLRSPELVEAHLAMFSGEGDPDRLAQLEDEATITAMGGLARLGFPITGGELRRTSYLDPLLNAFEPETFSAPEQGIELPWHDRNGLAPQHIRDMRVPMVTGQLVPTGRHVLEEEGQFVLDNLGELNLNDPVVKMTLPSPAHLGVLGWNEQTRPYYATRADLMQTAANAMADEAKRLAEAGFNYIQVDNPVLHVFFDPQLRTKFEQRGVRLGELLQQIVECDNTVLQAAKAVNPNVITGLHVCLGNAMGYRAADGNYDQIAQPVFGKTEADRLLLEYADITGGFRPLVHMPEDRVAVLGLVSSKRSKLENPALLRTSLEEAVQYLPGGKEQAALSTQCGFASGLMGNPLTTDQQWAKLRLVRDVANDMWK